MNANFAHRKALVKTISWRCLALVFTTLGLWMVTGRPTFAASVGIFEITIKFGGYYLHERLWERIYLRGVSTPRFFPWFVFKKSQEQEEEQQCQQLS
jgi:uncharacterized membrane protein